MAKKDKGDFSIYDIPMPPVMEYKEPTAKEHTLMYLGAMARHSNDIDFKITDNQISISIKLKEN